MAHGTTRLRNSVDKYLLISVLANAYAKGRESSRLGLGLDHQNRSQRCWKLFQSSCCHRPYDIRARYAESSGMLLFNNTLDFYFIFIAKNVGYYSSDKAKISFDYGRAVLVSLPMSPTDSISFSEGIS